MKIFRLPQIPSALALCGILVLLAGVAMANPIGGTATLSFLQNQVGVTPGTASGYFVFDPAANNGAGGITSFNITTTASSNGAFGTRTYNSADVGTAPTVIIISNSNGD